MRIEMNCRRCGKNPFTLEHAHADEVTVYCAECGERLGTMAELKDRVAAEVMSRSKASPRRG